MKKRSLLALVLALVIIMSVALVACDGNGGKEVVPTVGPAQDAGEVVLGTTLESVELPAGYRWKEVDTIIEDGIKDYDAIYIKDNKEYPVTIAVKAKVLGIEYSTQIVGTIYKENDTLAIVKLPKNYSWKDATTKIMDGTNEYPVIFSVGAFKAETTAVLTAVKADAVKVEEIPTIVVEEKDKPLLLGDVTEPDNVDWVNEDMALKAGVRNYPAILYYTYDDGYVEISITVSIDYKAKPTESMKDEEMVMDYIEAMLNTEAFKKGGASYTSGAYDQYVMVLARSKRGINNDIKEAYLARNKEVVLPSVDKVTGKTSYLVNTAMALISLGESTVIDGVDIACSLYDINNIQDEEFFLINNLNVLKNIDIPKEYNTPDGVKHTSTTTVKAVVDMLMARQLADGGWANQWSNGAVDADTTTMAVMALSGIKGDDAFNVKMDKAIGVIKGFARGDNGGLLGWNAAENISSTATAISALASRNVDVAQVKNDKGKSLMDFLTKSIIKTGDNKGGFSIDGENVDQFSLKDGAMALINYNRFLRAEKSFYEINIK